MKERKKAKIKCGIYWHQYHLGLVSYCFDYDKRLRAIRTRKPKHEIESRIKWFQPVKGKLPDAVVKAANILTKAEVAYDKVRIAKDKAWDARDDSWAAFGKADDACNKAGDAYNDAKDAFKKAIADNNAAIEKLHKKECPDCTWNGKELVF